MEVYEPISLPDLFLPGEYGLESVVNWVPGTAHWGGGVQYDMDCAEVGVTIDPCISGAPDPIATKTVTWAHDTRGARAFEVYARADCTPGGSTWWDDAQTKVLKSLSQEGPTQMETTFWTGASGNPPVLVYPNLVSTGPIRASGGRILLQPANGAIISGTVPLDVVEGLGRLEAALGTQYRGIGVIHVPKVLGPALAAQKQIYEKAGKLYTYCGNLVAIGAGYPSNVGPGFTTPPTGTTWMIATGPIFGIRGQPVTFTREQSLNRSVNTLQMIAEQKILLGWQCGFAAVLVTTGGEPAGDPGTPLLDT